MQKTKFVEVIENTDSEKHNHKCIELMLLNMKRVVENEKKFSLLTPTNSSVQQESHSVYAESASKHEKSEKNENPKNENDCIQMYMMASNIFKIYGCGGSPHRSARKWPTILESKVRREHGDVDNKTTWVGRMSQNVSDHHVRRCLKKCGGYRNYLGFPAIPQKCS